MREDGKFKKGHKKVGGIGKRDKMSEQAKKKISQSLYGKKGKLSRRWTGDLAGYTAIHDWVRKQSGKASDCENLDCERLPTSRYEWASLSGECKRSLKDFIQLCTRCHRKFDNGNLEITLTDGRKLKREKFVICEKCNHKNVL